MTDKFSWKRFFRFARAEQASERREMLLKLGGFIAFCSVTYILLNLNMVLGINDGWTDNNGVFHINKQDVTPRIIIGFGMVILIYLNISSGFKNYFSSARAAQVLMLPVTKGEKFLYVVLKNLIVIPFVLLLIAVLSDIGWSDFIEANNLIEAIDDNYKRTLDFEAQAGVMITSLIAMGINCFASYAFYLFGAVFFRSRQLILTLLLQISLFILVVILLQSLEGNMPFMVSLDKFPTANDLLNISTVLGMGFTSFWIYLAWYRYSRLQITK